MSKPALSYGLNFSKKPPPSLRGNKATATPQNLSSQLSARKQTAAAETLDASIYDYDSYYDAAHSDSPRNNDPSRPAGPKYMARLLEAAETRKRDQLRAKEKMLAKEREAEGEEYADKEKFVTGAYKAQQAEVRRLEELESRREAEEAERRKLGGGGMRGLYKGLLEREERRYEDVVRRVEEVRETGRGKGMGESGGSAEGRAIDGEAEEDGSREALNLARKAGADVNEDGQVVDKRELLKAGLNVKAKKPTNEGNRGSGGGGIERSESMAILSGGRNASKQAMRERQSRMLEAQLEAAAKRVADGELEEQEAVQRAAKSRKTEGEISSARERYLQRKREAEAAKAAEDKNDV